jgi:hypothetical protein
MIFLGKKEGFMTTNERVQNQVVAFFDESNTQRYFSIMDCIEYEHRKYWLLHALEQSQNYEPKYNWKILEDFDTDLFLETMSCNVQIVEDEVLLYELISRYLLDLKQKNDSTIAQLLN